MVLLCFAHHRLVHEGKWGITGRPDGDMWFVDRGGRKHPVRPPNLARAAA
jgi:hypothetical protein